METRLPEDVRFTPRSTPLFPFSTPVFYIYIHFHRSSHFRSLSSHFLSPPLSNRTPSILVAAPQPYVSPRCFSALRVDSEHPRLKCATEFSRSPAPISLIRRGGKTRRRVYYRTRPNETQTNQTRRDTYNYTRNGGIRRRREKLLVIADATSFLANSMQLNENRMVHPQKKDC